MTDTDEVQTPWYVWHGNGAAIPQTHPVNDDIYCRKCWAGLTIPDLHGSARAEGHGRLSEAVGWG